MSAEMTVATEKKGYEIGFVKSMVEMDISCRGSG